MGRRRLGWLKQLGISNEEAADFIARYFERYQGVQRYIADCLSEARDTGVTQDALRPHPATSGNQFEERHAAQHGRAHRHQFPIQGTAADIIKIAMIRIAEDLEREKLRTRMVLQVHDELIFEVPEDELQIQHRIRERMQNVVQLGFRSPSI